MRKILILFFLAAFVVFGAGTYTLLGDADIVPSFGTETLAYFFGRFEGFRNLTGHILEWRRLSLKNEMLEEENRHLLSRAGLADILEEENEFLKEALNIRRDIGREVVYAHVFNINLGPGGYNTLLNRGLNDGISIGDVVVTGTRQLVGIVEEVSANSSRVTFVYDPKFKATAKVLGGQTTGIVRGTLRDGMNFDLVAREDVITEGDIIISTGDDFFPQALVIGEVTHVETSDAQAFKKVKIRPAIEGERLDRVMVIGR